jgi:sugar/nucleoside kinase (ribokinase family)
MTKKSAGKGIVVIGELNIDVIATGLSEAPKIGSEILASDFQLTLGSASAIFASGVAKLGHPVIFISRVGVDDFGKFCLAALREAGISTRYVSRDQGVKTGVTVSLSTSRDRALVTYLGSIAALGHEHIQTSSLKGQSHLHMTSYFLQSRLRPHFPQLFREAQQMGLTTSFDPNSDPSQAWSDSIRGVLAHTDVLFLNETEALHFTRARSARSALKTLSGEVPCAVIKLGARGAVAVKDREITSARGFKVKPTDTTGAGDSFAAGFISSYLRGGSIAECLHNGNACGALSTLLTGGTAGQPSSQALKKFLGAHRAAEHIS